jgi:thiol-disulfide isomerase/thioredoxin
MSEVRSKKTPPDLLRRAIWGVALVGVAGALYVIAASSIKPRATADLADLKKGELAKLEVPASPRPAPDIAFSDETGKPLKIADFKGEVLLVNLWASWCAPCKKEMPTLARVQASYAVQPFKVLAVSVDKDEDLDLARADIAANPPLKLYRDPGYKLAFGLEPRAQGFPTTIIYDKQGFERARLAGDADWSGQQAREMIERLLREK